jgi:HAD superfamily hydrolase (TIGR01509 family)
MSLTLLFDLDGTMVNTDHLHISAWNAVLAEGGRQINSAFYETFIMGASAEAVTSALYPEFSAEQGLALSDAKEAVFRSQVGRLEATAGLPEILSWAESLSLRMAVVTNAPRDNAMLLLRGLGWADRFSVLVIGDELTRGKPDPLPYLTAMQRLNADASGSIAFEDSLSGVRAAVAAGVETVGVMTALREDVLRRAGASMVVQDFTDLMLIEHLHRRASRLGPGRDAHPA